MRVEGVRERLFVECVVDLFVHRRTFYQIFGVRCSLSSERTQTERKIYSSPRQNLEVSQFNAHQDKGSENSEKSG